jgi:hypothetical protein
LEVQSFWNDEGNSARLSERPIPAIIEGTASDVHPPLYYLALRGWRELVGETEFGLRSFSTFAGILTVAAVVALGRWLAGWGVGLLAGLLAAVNPALVYYSQEARMYALLALLAVLSTLALLRWFGRYPARGWGKWAVAYILFAAAGLYTHYFFPAVLLVHIVIFLIWLLRPQYLPQRHKDTKVLRGSGGAEERRSGGDVRARLVVWIGVMGVTVLLYAPWLPVFWRQVGGRTGVRPSLDVFIEESGRWVAFGATVIPDTVRWPLVAVVVLAIMGIVVGGRRAVIPLLGVVVPLAFLYASAATDPAYFKFLLAAVPFLCLLLGLNWLWAERQSPSAFVRVGIRECTPRSIKLTIGAVIVVLAMVMLWGSTHSLNNQYTNTPPFTRADYRGMAARITAEGHPNAAILLNGPNQWEVFTYYYQGDAPVYPLPLGQPDPAILEPELARIAEEHDRLYVLYWGDTQRDPQRVIEHWLDTHAFKASEEWVGDVRFVVYSLEETAEELVVADVGFILPEGGHIRLVGYSPLPEVVRPGDIIPITLMWQADAIPQRRYKVFLHLVGEDGLPVAQRDSEPVGGLRPTTTWTAGESIIDRYGILVPQTLEKGGYAVYIGLYDPTNPLERLPVQDNENIGGAFLLGFIGI